MKKLILSILFTLVLIGGASAEEKIDFIEKFGSIGFGAKKLNYNYDCTIDKEFYDESLYNRLLETVGPFAFGLMEYNHPKGKLLLFNTWSEKDSYYQLPIASTYKVERDNNLGLISPVINNAKNLVINDLQFKSDKIILYRSSYKLDKTSGNKFWEKFIQYNNLLSSSRDDAIELLNELKIDLAEYISNDQKQNTTIVYSCNDW